MHAPVAAAPVALAPLRARLAGGLVPGVAQTRGAERDSRDDAALGAVSQPGQALLSLLDELSRLASAWAPFEDMAAALSGLADGLARDRSAVIAALFSPQLLLDRVSAGRDVVDGWRRACWVAEGLSSLIGGRTAGPGPHDPDPVTADDRQLFAPLAARLRFLLLSEPFRHRSDSGSVWVSAGVPNLGELFGADTTPRVASECRQARWAWQRCLDEYDSHPLLAAACGEQIEAELRTLVFERTGPALLVLTTEPLAAPVAPRAVDRAVAAGTLERHLLPRFMLGAAWALAGAVSSVARPWARRQWPAAVAVALAVAASVLAVVPAGRWHAYAAAVCAAAAYGVVLLGTVLRGPLWAAPWLLRQPAAAAVGLLILLTLPASWWSQPGAARLGWSVPALTLAAFGYLLVEARNHGVDRPAEAGRRAAAVAGMGLVHAWLVSVAGLVLVAPSYVDGGRHLAELWRGRGIVQPVEVLALSTAWCLAAGVFSQILWDDRPITAPLAHLNWRRRS